MPSLIFAAIERPAFKGSFTDAFESSPLRPSMSSANRQSAAAASRKRGRNDDDDTPSSPPAHAPSSCKNPV
jgi:hypothetical protein